MIAGGQFPKDFIQGIEKCSFNAFPRHFVALGGAEKIVNVDVPMF